MSKNYIKQLLLLEANQRTKKSLNKYAEIKNTFMGDLLHEALVKIGFIKTAGGLSGSSNLAFSDNTDWTPLDMESHPRIKRIAEQIETVFGGHNGKVFYKINGIKQAILRGVLNPEPDNVPLSDANEWWSPEAENNKDKNVDERDGRPPNIYFRYQYRRTIMPKHNDQGYKKAKSVVDFIDQTLNPYLTLLKGKKFSDFINALESYNIPLAPYYHKSLFPKQKGFVNSEDITRFIIKEANKNPSLKLQFPELFDQNGQRYPNKNINATGGVGSAVKLPIRTISSTGDMGSKDKDFLDQIQHSSTVVSAIGWKSQVYDLDEKSLDIAIGFLISNYMAMDNIKRNSPNPIEQQKYKTLVLYFNEMKKRIISVWKNRCFSKTGMDAVLGRFAKDPAFSDNSQAYNIKERFFLHPMSGLPLYARPPLEKGKPKDPETLHSPKKSEMHLGKATQCPFLTLNELKLLFRCLIKPKQNVQLDPRILKKVGQLKINEIYLPHFSGIFTTNGWDVNNNKRMPLVPQVRKIPTGDIVWDRDNHNLGRTHLVKNWRGIIQDSNGPKEVGLKKMLDDGWGDWCRVFISLLRNPRLLQGYENKARQTDENSDTGYVKTIYETLINVIGKASAYRRTGADHVYDLMDKYSSFDKDPNSSLKLNHLDKSLAAEIEYIYALDEDHTRGRHSVFPEIINASTVLESSPDQIEDSCREAINRLSQEDAFTAAKESYLLQLHLFNRYISRKNLSYDIFARCLKILSGPLFALSSLDKSNYQEQGSVTLGDLENFVKNTGRTTNRMGWSEFDKTTCMSSEEDYNLYKKYAFDLAKTMDFLSALMERSCVTKVSNSNEFVLYGRNYGTSTGKSGTGQVYLGVKYAYRPKLTKDPDLSKKISYWQGKYGISPSTSTYQPTTAHPQRGNVMEPLSDQDRAMALNVEIVEDVKYWIGTSSSQSNWLKNLDHASGMSFRLTLERFLELYPDLEQQTGGIISPLNVSMDKLESAVHNAIQRVRQEINRKRFTFSGDEAKSPANDNPNLSLPNATSSSSFRYVYAQIGEDLFIPIRITYRGVTYEPDITQDISEKANKLIEEPSQESVEESVPANEATKEVPPVSNVATGIPTEPTITPTTEQYVQPQSSPAESSPVQNEVPVGNATTDIPQEPKQMPKQINRITKNPGDRRLIVNRASGNDMINRIIAIANNLDIKQETGLASKFDLLLEYIAEDKDVT